MLTEDDKLNQWIDQHIVIDPETGYRTADAQLTAFVKRRQIGIPRLFIKSTFGQFARLTPQHDFVARQVESWAMSARDRQCGLLITGDTGIGKTHLAVAALIRLIDRRYSPRFIDYRRLLDDCRMTSWEFNPVDEWIQPDALLIDDFGSIKPSEGQRDKVSTILSLRINEEKLTILTSNQVFPAEYRKLIDDRLASRIEYHYTKVQPSGIEDYRRAAA